MGDATASGLFGWWREGDAKARTALLAASLGWMLDAFDFFIVTLVIGNLSGQLSPVIPEFIVIPQGKLQGGMA